MSADDHVLAILFDEHPEHFKDVLTSAPLLSCIASLGYGIQHGINTIAREMGVTPGALRFYLSCFPAYVRISNSLDGKGMQFILLKRPDEHHPVAVKSSQPQQQQDDGSEDSEDSEDSSDSDEDSYGSDDQDGLDGDSEILRILRSAPPLSQEQLKRLASLDQLTLLREIPAGLGQSTVRVSESLGVSPAKLIEYLRLFPEFSVTAGSFSKTKAKSAHALSKPVVSTLPRPQQSMAARSLPVLFVSPLPMVLPHNHTGTRPCSRPPRPGQ